MVLPCPRRSPYRPACPPRKGLTPTSIKACYDLASQPCSFDFATWLAVARTNGAQEVRFSVDGGFKSKDYGDPRERFESILKPLCELVGVPYSIGKKEGHLFGHFISDLIGTYKKFGRLEKYGKYEGGEYTTVTVRNSRKEYRNSSDDWRKFAKEIGALVIPDYADVKIDLAERFRIYQNARLNLFVNNGPAMLCICSDIPYGILKYANKGGATNEEWLAGQGLPRGSQYPWANERQRIFWGGDSYSEIREAFEEMNER